MSKALPPERQKSETPGEFLGRMLSRAKTNPHRLSADLGGAVSATTIRTYVADRREPPSYALRNLALIAQGLGKYGPAVLRAYGEVEAAADLETELATTKPKEREEERTLTYVGRELTEDELAAVRVIIDTIVRRR